MNSFKSGHTQLLPFRDRSGRRVLVSHLKGKSFDAEIRVGSSSGVCVLVPFLHVVWRTKISYLFYCTYYQFKISQYLWLVACEDEDTQRNGIVLVPWGFGEGIQYPDQSDLTSELVDENVNIWNMMNQLTSLSYTTEGRQLTDSLPLRIACFHQCFPDSPLFQFYRAVFVMIMNGANDKMRLQTHLGSSSCEIRYRLLGYGIPVDRTCSSIRDH
jgi:hypothetical protein